MEKDYLTVKDMVKLFNLSKSTIYRKIKTGYLPSVKKGNKILIPRNLLKDFLEKRKEESVKKLQERREKARERNKTLVEFWEKIEKDIKNH